MIRDNKMYDWEWRKTERRDYVRFKQRKAWHQREPAEIKPGWMAWCDGCKLGGHFTDQDAEGRPVCRYRPAETDKNASTALSEPSGGIFTYQETLDMSADGKITGVEYKRDE